MDSMEVLIIIFAIIGLGAIFLSLFFIYYQQQNRFLFWLCQNSPELWKKYTNTHDMWGNEKDDLIVEEDNE